jgi:hypothetical protein
MDRSKECTAVVPSTQGRKLILKAKFESGSSYVCFIELKSGAFNKG